MHKARHDHTMEFMQCVDSLTQEVHHDAVSVMGSHHVNVTDDVMSNQVA